MKNIFPLTLAHLLIICLISTTGICKEYHYRSDLVELKADKSCSEENLNNIKINFVLNSDIVTAEYGWVYGNSITTGKITRSDKNRFYIIDSATDYYKLNASEMVLKKTDKDIFVEITTEVPKDEYLKDAFCFYTKIVLRLKKESKISDINPAETFKAEILLHEADELLYKYNQPKQAIVKAKESLEIYDKIYNKLSEKALNASAIIAFSLKELERYDEAIAVLTPYLERYPKNGSLIEVIEIFVDLKNKQDKLFQYEDYEGDNISFGDFG